MFTFLHAADFHLDSAFGALTARQAATRRKESRELATRLSNYVNQNAIDLVLLAGDLFDSGSAFRETGEQLAAALGQMQAKVFIAPGNHDWYGPNSAYATVAWPENVHIFKSNVLETIDLPELNATVSGGAHLSAEQATGLLSGFSLPRDNRVHLGLLHGELEPSEPRYNPIRKEEIAASGLAYLALGHIHKRTEPLRFGETLCAWPGCPEGRGFDELGEKGFYRGTVDDAGGVTLQFVPFALRRQEILEVDITGKDPQTAILEALPDRTTADLYRILLTGETGERGVDLPGLTEALSDRFYTLELRDHTRVAEDLWARAEEDSLRGLFLRELRLDLTRAETEEEREKIARAVRFGLAALDHRDVL